MDGGYIVANDECVLLMLSLYSVGTVYNMSMRVEDLWNTFATGTRIRNGDSVLEQCSEGSYIKDPIEAGIKKNEKERKIVFLYCQISDGDGIHCTQGRWIEDASVLLQYRFNDHPQEEIGEDDADEDDEQR